MVSDHSSSNETPKDEPDILDLKANAPVEAEPSAFHEEPLHEQPPEPEPAVAASAASTSTSSMPGLVAAGILGGLIALTAAGSMQYAGYLPSTGSKAQAPIDNTDEISTLRQEIDGLKQQLAGIPADIQPTGDLEKRIAAMEATGNGASGAADPAFAEQLTRLQQTVEGMKSEAAKIEGSADSDIAALAARLEAAEKTLREQPGEAAVSKAIAATYLKAAVDRGDPFLTELETFAALSPDDPAVAELKAMASTGVKSKAALSAGFDDMAKAALEAVNQPLQGEGLTDRLLASARSLISVRPVGNVEGSDAGAILARMEERLKNGDIKGAALEWEGLPETARKASEGFRKELEARARADELTRGLAERTATPAVNAG